MSSEETGHQSAPKEPDPSQARIERRAERKAQRDERREQQEELVRERVQAFLEPGEQIHLVVPAQTGVNPNLRGLFSLFVAFNQRLLIAVTDRAVVLLQAGRTHTLRPDAVQARLPRTTVLGPKQSGLFLKLSLPTPTYVARRYLERLEDADSLARGGASGEP